MRADHILEPRAGKQLFVHVHEQRHGGSPLIVRDERASMS
jgi:hypothetical protein